MPDHISPADMEQILEALRHGGVAAAAPPLHPLDVDLTLLAKQLGLDGPTQDLLTSA
jgi:hypothetical protein